MISLSQALLNTKDLHMISSKTIETCVFSVGIAKLSNNMIVQTPKTSREHCLSRFGTSRSADWCQNLSRHNEPPTRVESHCSGFRRRMVYRQSMPVLASCNIIYITKNTHWKFDVEFKISGKRDLNMSQAARTILVLS